MTRYAMVADLRRCVGCQTCTAACKLTNATPPGVQWRKVLDVELGEYPNAERVFMPVGCQHCSDPPCLDVCPSTATRKRADGIVTIDYDICIGCAYCAVACPYQARYKVEQPRLAYDKPTRTEEQRFDERRLGVAQKCTFCVDRIDEGTAQGLTPGVDPDATPACANACIANALVFGDLEDPQSNVSRLLDDVPWFQMHQELGTNPGFYYLWDKERT
ncbi:MAG: 4Fe-4S dicluster domain-containing protein [Burkholderiaceae bacterium]